MEKLISMVDFVLLQETKLNAYYFRKEKAFSLVLNYANFLKQSLTLGMFVPCDLDGNVLEPVIKMDYTGFEDYGAKYPVECYEYDLKKYEEAKQRVFFNGFELKYYSLSNKAYLKKKGSGFILPYQGWNVESILTYSEKFRPTLTETAKKQIGIIN